MSCALTHLRNFPITSSFEYPKNVSVAWSSASLTNINQSLFTCRISIDHPLSMYSLFKTFAFGIQTKPSFTLSCFIIQHLYSFAPTFWAVLHFKIVHLYSPQKQGIVSLLPKSIVFWLVAMIFISL